MQIRFLASFIFICIYLTSLASTIAANPTPAANKNEPETLNNMSKTKNDAITPTNKTETVVKGTEKTAKTLADNIPEKKAISEESNKPKNPTSNISPPSHNIEKAEKTNQSKIKGGTDPTIASSQDNIKDKKPHIDIPLNNNSTTESTTTESDQEKPDDAGSGFHGLSFFVGILFSTGVIIVSYGCYRHYKKSRRNTSLLSQENYTSF